MTLREHRLYDIQRKPKGERAEFGTLVLGTRKWVRGLRSDIIDIWLPDTAPSEELLNAVHEKRKELLALCGKKGAFLRNRLAPKALQEWERFWYEEFAPRYRKDLHRRQSCRVVTFKGEGRDVVEPLSPIDYFLSLETHSEKQNTVTVLCCEGDGEECHRHLFLADTLIIQAARRALAQAPCYSLKVRMRGTMTEQAQTALKEKEVEIGAIPYLRLGQYALYSATIHHQQGLISILELSGIVSAEPMPTLSPAVSPPKKYIGLRENILRG